MSHKAQRAVIVAAGKGERLKPLTERTPKPLIKAHGKPMIETMIEGFIQNGISEIYIVVGHLKEQFDYLRTKYQTRIYLLENPYYTTHNNISSLYIAREHLENAIVCDGDLILKNPAILRRDFEYSGYCSMWTEETDEWLQTLDDDGFVVDCNPKGGKLGWQLFSVSFWGEADGKKLKNHLEELFYDNPQAFWDEIPIFLRRDAYRLKIRPIQPGDIIEIDTVEELKLFEKEECK
jgi:CTP:phosphocholine cytidylyltransferase-like protein